MIPKSLPLVTEVIGFKLKKLNFDWKVNHKHSELQGLVPSITLDGVNYNSDTLVRDENFGNICSIPSIALVVHWLELEHGLFIGKDWMKRSFNLVDLKSMNKIEPLIELSLDEGEILTPDFLVLIIVDLALDYLIKSQNPSFGDIVKLTNNQYGRCINSVNAVYYNPRNLKELEVGDIDLKFFQTNGRIHSVGAIIPSLNDIKQFETPHS